MRPKDSDVLKQQVLLRYGIQPNRLNRTRAAICNGQLSLQQGQQVFLGDWWQA